MNGKWIEVFKGGRQTDSAGNTREWTDADLDTIVSAYNGQADHQAPIVVGHPEHDSPAFGWVEALKREGKLLMARLKSVPDEFAELVKKGTYKKRSIALYPDLTLRHIGFLGGMPPAVKGLADIAFRDKGEAITFEFSDWRMSTVGRIVMKLRDYLVEKEGADKADNIIGSWEVQDLLTPPPEIEETALGPHYQEEDMKPEEVQALIDKALEGQTTKFNEQLAGIADGIRKITETVTGVQTRFAETEDANARREFTAFCEGLATRVLPAEIPTLVDQMMNLRKAPAVEFGEGDGKGSRSAVDDFKARLSARAETIRFGEFAGKERAGQRATGTAGDRLTAITRDKMEKNRDLTYAAAFNEAQSENPDLANEYAQEIRG